MCYQRTKNFDKLSFLYLITGNLDKLRKMTKIAEIRKDISSQFLGALYLGDVEDRVKLLKSCDQTLLAYLTAATHGLTDEADALLEHCGETVPEVRPDAQLLRPPVPICQAETNWPLLTVSRSFFEGSATKSKYSTIAAPEDEEDPLIDGGGEGWDADLELDDEEQPVAASKSAATKSDDEDAGWDVGDDDLELPPDVVGAAGDQADQYFVCPTYGTPDIQQWINNSSLAIDHVCSGSFHTAFGLLCEQIGACQFQPFRQLFMTAFAQCRTAYTPLPLTPPLFVYPRREHSASKGPAFPAVVYQLPALIENLQTCYQLTTGGKFSEAVDKFRAIILTVPLLVVDSKQDVAEAKQLLAICKEYVVALQMEVTRKDLPKATVEEQLRVCELSAYFTHCNLQPIHEILTLRSAVNLFYKMRNFRTAAAFARRLLELGPKPDVAQSARRILQVCERTPEDEHRIEYDERNPFSICSYSYVPIYRGKPEEKCSFCAATYLPKHKGSVCNVCKVGEIGKTTSGLRISLENF